MEGMMAGWNSGWLELWMVGLMDEWNDEKKKR
jgi:hypothetical protein